MRRSSAGVLGCILLSSCNHASKPMAAGSGDRADPTRAASEGALDRRAALDADVETQSLAARFRSDEGCAREFHPMGVALDDMTELARRCARGMTPVLTAPVSLSVSSTRTVDVPFSIATATCFRVGVIAPSAGLSVSVLDPQSAPLVSASSAESFDVVPVDGPVCVRDLGTYRAVVRVASSSVDAATVAVQIWQVARD